MNAKKRIIIGSIFLIISFIMCWWYMGFSSSSFYGNLASSALIYTILLIIPMCIVLFSIPINIKIKILMYLYVILVLLLSILRGVTFSDLPGGPAIFVIAIFSLISIYLIETKSWK